ncbi:hypothetical protein A1OO_18240 [Enterovibrio norvegicus FF-33]|nr:hypothetical protein A1OO_18240 [Enterovibrio norvegicus FF-33]
MHPPIIIQQLYRYSEKSLFISLLVSTKLTKLLAHAEVFLCFVTNERVFFIQNLSLAYKKAQKKPASIDAGFNKNSEDIKPCVYKSYARLHQHHHQQT